MGKTSRVPIAWCPHCRHVVDRATSSGKLGETPEDCAPEPGDRTACVYCWSWSVYTDSFALRKATEAELRLIERDAPAFYAFVEQRRKIKSAQESDP